jgi:hypothetical protein
VGGGGGGGGGWTEFAASDRTAFNACALCLVWQEAYNKEIKFKILYTMYVHWVIAPSCADNNTRSIHSIKGQCHEVFDFRFCS